MSKKGSTPTPNVTTPALEVKIKNCFGIGSLEHTFEFTKEKNVALVYASNGVMKTSFTKALDLYRYKTKERYDINTGKTLNGSVEITPKESQIFSLSNIKTLQDMEEVLVGSNPPTPVRDLICMNDETQEIVNKLESVANENNNKIRIEHAALFQNKKIEVQLNADDTGINYDFNIIFNGKPITKEIASSIFSEGEFTILKLFILVQWRKTENTTYLIIDDIVDSFDYGNKHAIIAYLADLADEKNEDDSPKFYLITLTHNYDFYRSLWSRLNAERVLSYSATKDDNGTVTINKEVSYFRNFLKGVIIAKIKENLPKSLEKHLIAGIPFFRNLAEYQDNTASEQFFTNLLHIKEDTEKYTLQNLLDHITPVLPNINPKIELKDHQIKPILELIYELANESTNPTKTQSTTQTEFSQLPDKLILAIAIRLKAETFMISKLDKKSIKNIPENQTRKLFNDFKDTIEDKNSETLSTLRQVLIITPEFIHLNAFMYEPLIDTPIETLHDLYKKVSALLESTSQTPDK